MGFEPASELENCWILSVYRAVLVAALGYFVDIYDLILFSIVRVDSLKSLGCTGIELERNGVLILNMQMLGNGNQTKQSKSRKKKKAKEC